MILLECPNCGNEVEYDGIYDENIEEQIQCSSCVLEFSKFNYRFIKSIKENVEDDTDD